MRSSQQIPLELTQPESYDLSDYVVSSCNVDAVQFLEQWPASDGFHFAAIVGPSGAGKTHLLKGWGHQHQAEELSPETGFSAIAEDRIYFIDDVDQVGSEGGYIYSDTFLFHLYNWAKEKRAKILVSASSAPNQWERSLPDLKSRLGTLPVATIQQPDDDLLFALLFKLFSDRQLSVNIQVIRYLIDHMPRSFSAAGRIAKLMDEKALAERRKITRDLARRCLEEL